MLVATIRALQKQNHIGTIPRGKGGRVTKSKGRLHTVSKSEGASGAMSSHRRVLLEIGSRFNRPYLSGCV